MTYMEKLMSAVKLDDEMLMPYEIERLSRAIAGGIVACDCPYMYEILRKSSANVSEGLEPGECGFEGACEDCWDQEIPA